MSGQTDLPPSVMGEREVECLAALLRHEPPFDALYASPLSRAVRTAEALLRAGVAPWVRLRDDLKEIDCGAVDGLPIEDVQRVYAKDWLANVRQDDDDFRWPGGESYRELRGRVQRAMTKLAALHPNQRVAVVTHAGVINQVLGSICGLPAAKWEPYRPANVSLTEVEWSGDRGILVAFDRRPLVPALQQHDA